MEQLGDLIKEIRKEKKLTLVQLGEKTGLTHGYLSNLENNVRKNPSMEVLKKIAAALDVDYYTLAVLSGIENEKTVLMDKLQEELTNAVYTLNLTQKMISDVQKRIDNRPEEREKEKLIEVNDAQRQLLISYEKRIHDLKKKIKLLSENTVTEYEKKLYGLVDESPEHLLIFNSPKYEKINIQGEERYVEISRQQARERFLSLEYLFNMNENINLENEKLTTKEKQQLLEIAKIIFRNRE